MNFMNGILSLENLLQEFQQLLMYNLKNLEVLLLNLPCFSQKTECFSVIVLSSK